MKEEKKICHYLDLPIQHCSDKILKKMGRRTTKQELIDIVTLLRKEIPDKSPPDNNIKFESTEYPEFYKALSKAYEDIFPDRCLFHIPLSPVLLKSVPEPLVQPDILPEKSVVP